MAREELVELKRYYSIIAGNFRTQAVKDDPKAVAREWKSTDGTKSGIKHERVVRALYGYITDVSFFDSEYGLKLYISLDKDVDGSQPVISIICASREAED